MDHGAVDSAIRQGSYLIQTILSASPSDFPHIEALIKGAPLWYQDEDGLSALHAACLVEHPEVVQKLIDFGAVWNCGAQILAFLMLRRQVACSRSFREYGRRCRALAERREFI